MNIEIIGIAALCASQVGMWIREWTTEQQLDRLEAGATEAHQLLHAIERRAGYAANAAEDYLAGGLSTTALQTQLHEMRDEIRAALQRMPKSRNRRRPNPDAPIDLVPTTIAPLEAGKRHAPSSDPVGKVSS